MHELAPLIYDLAIMLGVAGIVILLFQRIHQPVVLGYLIAGIIIGPYTPPRSLVSDIPSIQTLSELGVIFLMFSLGLEFSFQKLVRVGFSAFVTGFIEVVLMLLIGLGVGELMGWSLYDSLFLGAALAISSTTIIIKAIDELKLKTKRFAELVFGVLIVEDLFAILLLAGLSTLVATHSFFSMEMLSAGGRLILVVGGWFLFGYFLVPPLFRKIARYISQETLTIISVALCLLLVCIAVRFHYSTALGAFIMGSILAETILIKRIEKLMEPIRDIFAAVFFISVGMLINPTVIVDHWQAVLLISLITVFGKLLTTGLGALLTGQSLTTSVRVGFSMAQVGEFSFIIAALGASLNVTSNKLYPIIVAVSGITTFTTPYLIRFSGYLSTALEKHLPDQTKYFLSQYSAWVYRAQTTARQNPFLGSVSVRIVVNGIMVAIIFTVIDNLIYPQFMLYEEDSWLSNVIRLLLAIGISSPFIWGMLFSFRVVKFPDYARIYLNPAVFVIWLITLSEIIILGILYFQAWSTLLIFGLLAIGFFAISYRQLEKSYEWFETQLVSNITQSGKPQQVKYEELAPWDTHLIEVEIGENSSFVGKALGECDIRKLYGVNVVAISHGSRVIAAPRGEERIVANDKLIVLGTDDQIDAFRMQAELTDHDIPQKNFLEDFGLKSILLAPENPLVGKTIRTSCIREQINGLVVGLERDGNRILNPDPDTELKADDLLLIVGELEKIYDYYV